MWTYLQILPQLNCGRGARLCWAPWAWPHEPARFGWALLWADCVGWHGPKRLMDQHGPGRIYMTISIVIPSHNLLGNYLDLYLCYIRNFISYLWKRINVFKIKPNNKLKKLLMVKPQSNQWLNHNRIGDVINIQFTY